MLPDGPHTLERCCEITEEVLRTVFNQLYTQRVILEGMILIPNMVLPGSTCSAEEEVSEVGVGEQKYQVRLMEHQQAEVQAVDEVADTTVRCLLRTVPAAVPGIAFLSGGQSCELASARLNAINIRFKSRLPWALAFSFARAIQQPAWRFGKDRRPTRWQRSRPCIIEPGATCNRAAHRGVSTTEMEST